MHITMLWVEIFHTNTFGDETESNPCNIIQSLNVILEHTERLLVFTQIHIFHRNILPG